MRSEPDEWLIMWAGSEVAEVREHDGGVLLRLAVAALQPEMSPRWGRDPSRRFITGVEVWCVQSRAASLDPAAFGALADGTLMVAGRSILSIPVPWHTDEPVHLNLRFAQGAELVVQGRGLRVQLSSDSRCVEHLSC